MMTSQTLRTLFAILLILLTAAACSPTASDPATPTLDQTAVVEGRLPTINAQLTQHSQEITHSAPTVQAIMTMIATSGPADPANITLAPTQPITPDTSSGSAAAPTIAATSDATFNDVNRTTQTQAITIGQTVSGNFPTATEAHNWTFQATAGQTITIRVTPSGSSDPRVRVFNPSNQEIASADDSVSGKGATLTVTLPVAGTYIIRVDTWGGGGYALSVE